MLLTMSRDIAKKWTKKVEAIGRNSNLGHLSKKWTDLRKRGQRISRRGPPLPRQDSLKPRSRRLLTARDITDIAHRYEVGATTQQVGNRYGISKTRVTTILREQGMIIRRQGLTDEQVTDCRGALLRGQITGVDRGPLQRLPHDRCDSPTPLRHDTSPTSGLVVMHEVLSRTRASHRTLGQLVQPPPHPSLLRRHPTRRTRECLLRSTPEPSRRLSTHNTKSPESPGRFMRARAMWASGVTGTIDFFFATAATMRSATLSGV